MIARAESVAGIRAKLQQHADDLRRDITAIRAELSALEAELAEADGALAAWGIHDPAPPLIAVPSPAVVSPRKTVKSGSPRLVLDAVAELLSAKGPATPDEIGHAFKVTDRRCLRSLDWWAKAGRLGRDDSGRFYALKLWERPEAAS